MKLSLLVGFMCILLTVKCDRTSDKIYYDIKGIGSCYRRFNATHQIGCASGRGGNTGVVHFIESDADLDWLVDEGPHKPYVALLTAKMFSRDNVMKLKDSDKINGILVISTNDTNTTYNDPPDKFSTAATCPNEMSDAYLDTKYAHCQEQVWNPDANELFYQDFGFPMMALTNTTEVNDGLIKKCFEKHNKPENGKARLFPLCSAQVKTAMDGAKDTETCMRRSRLMNNILTQVYCDALSSNTIYGFVHPIDDPETSKNHTVIMAVSRFDGNAIFDYVNELNPAADSAVSGVVTLLGAAAAIGRVREDIDPNTDKPIMFTFFPGEAWDYMGSQSMVFDMEQGKFPLNAKGEKSGPPLLKPYNIEQFVEVNQLGMTDPGGLWMHTHPLSQNTSLRDALLKTFSDESSIAGLDTKEANHLMPLPPASLQTFLKATDNNITGIVISDHEKAFTNQYYHSRFDTAELIGVTYPPGITGKDRYDVVTPAATKLAKISTTLARTLYTLSTGKTDTSKINVTDLEMTHLLYCFLFNPRCDLLSGAMNENYYKKMKEDQPLKWYTGVTTVETDAAWPVISLLRNFLGTNFTNATTAKECAAEKNLLYNYDWIRGPVNESSLNQTKRIPVCIQSGVSHHEAMSPAFQIKDYDWSSNKYSSWTESRWATDAITLRIFLVPSKEMEGIVLGCGIAVLILSIGGFYACSRSKMKHMFGHGESQLNEGQAEVRNPLTP